MVEFSSRDDEPERAQADWLTADEPARVDSRPDSPPPSSVGPDESYGIVGDDGGDPTEEPAAVVPPLPPPAPRPRKPAPALDAHEHEAEGAGRRERTGRRRYGSVDEVWTRWGEWGPDVIRLGLAAGLLLIPLYLALSSLWFFVAFLTLAGGGLLLAVLAYPLFITMERPVRITPEQAVNDYFAALSHQAPHHRRMWLLLSSAGRSNPSYSSFSEFKTYWKNTLDTLKMGKSSRFNPFVFTVQNFKSEKSAGQTQLEAKFTLNVRPRNDESAAGWNYPVVMGLVKGPDKMWYLDEGSMPKA